MGDKIFDNGRENFEVNLSGPNPYSLYLEHRANRDSNVHHKPKKKKKRYKEGAYDDYYDDSMTLDDFRLYVDFNHSSEREGNNIPDCMLLNVHSDPGFVFGLKREYGADTYVGMRQDEDRNIFVEGGSGSGKSVGIAKPTIAMWQAAFVATDIKGELSTYYAELFEKGDAKRPFIVFDPMDTDGIGYDPFWWLEEAGDVNLTSNIWQIVLAIISLPLHDSQPFWTETEQGILAASLRYYFKLGLSFSETILEVMTSTITQLVNKLMNKGDEITKMYLGELTEMKPEVRANFDRGLRNKLMLLATDPFIQNAFRGSREGAKCFNWSHLDECNIFIKIPGERIEQWGGAINLMLTQLIRHLERRPEMRSPEGANNIQTLLLWDEFARFGKLEMIASAMATLRSKSVNFCLIVQSIAQLDKHYGEDERRDILDNCQYQVILRSNDAETSRLHSDSIGTAKTTNKSMSVNLNDFEEITGRSLQISEVREPRVFSHELRCLHDVILLHPWSNGFCRLEKIRYEDNFPALPVLSSPAKRKSFVMERTSPEPKLLPVTLMPVQPGMVFDCQPVIAKRIKPDTTRQHEKGGVYRC